MKNIIIAITLLVFFKEAPNKKIELTQERITIEADEQKGESCSSNGFPNSVRINFTEFDVVLSEYSCYNSAFLGNYKSDTIPLDEAVGYDLDGQLLRIVPNSSEDEFKVYIAFEQDLRVVVGEKEVKDLEKWHTQEPFVLVKDSAQYFYRLPSYNRKEKEKSISKDFEKIKEEVLQLEGEYIDSTLETTTELKFLPIEFWISKVLIKIVHYSKNGKRTVLLKNQSSWGC